MLLKITQEHLDQATQVYDHGWYTIHVDELKVKEDKKGADLYVYTCTIIDADDEENKRFAKRKTFIQVSESGISFGIPFFRACGANIPEKIGPEGVSLNPEACVGKILKAQNNPGLDKNKVMRNNWAAFLAA
jgi:hypothetical protein